MSPPHDDNATTCRDLAISAFDEIVAAFDDQLCCEMTTLAGGECQRPARWRVDLHGCEQVNMCGQHKTAWLREAHARYGGSVLIGRPAQQPRCHFCGRVFSSVDAAVTVTAI